MIALVGFLIFFPLALLGLLLGIARFAALGVSALAGAAFSRLPHAR